ncbi:hypothetical protein GCM10009827_091830 [Dactylosporangium maewongense]|uniref:Uncharacterized protein n=1 Tax=Dactylosporangium maewongense TaxID=634393 RepID=A0ABP4N966_9ACTN
MLTDEGVVESEPIGEDDRLAVLAERLRPWTSGAVQWHREVSKSHRLSQSAGQPRNNYGFSQPDRAGMWEAVIAPLPAREVDSGHDRRSDAKR